MTGAGPRLQLLEWSPIGKGALLGRAKVRLPIGLDIADVAIFEKDGRRWAQMPSEVMRDFAGQPLKDDRGKIRYRSALRWSTKTLQDGFSAAVIASIEAEHGTLAEAVAA
jgi:hypothetical protein